MECAAGCERYDGTVFGLTIEKIMVIMVIAMFVLGPERLPGYAKKLGELVRSVKRMADGAKDRLRDEMGPEFDDVDWRQLDPRQYDPRRIIRDALVEDEREARQAARRSRVAEAAGRKAEGAESEITALEDDSTGAVGGSDGDAPVASKLHFDEEAT